VLFRRVSLAFVLASLLSVVAVAVIVFHLPEAGQSKDETSRPQINDVNQYNDDLDYHLREQRSQSRTGANFSPGLSRP
jgi:CHASE3 domain sensor protein